MTIPLCTTTDPPPGEHLLCLLGAVIRLLGQPYAWSLAITNQTYIHRWENILSFKFHMVSEGQVGRKQLFQGTNSHWDITRSRGTSLPLAHRELIHTLDSACRESKGGFCTLLGTGNQSMGQSTPSRCPSPLHAHSS